MLMFWSGFFHFRLSNVLHLIWKEKKNVRIFIYLNRFHLAIFYLYIVCCIDDIHIRFHKIYIIFDEQKPNGKLDILFLFEWKQCHDHLKFCTKPKHKIAFFNFLLQFVRVNFDYRKCYCKQTPVLFWNEMKWFNEQIALRSNKHN